MQGTIEGYGGVGECVGHTAQETAGPYLLFEFRGWRGAREGGGRALSPGFAHICPRTASLTPLSRLCSTRGKNSNRWRGLTKGRAVWGSVWGTLRKKRHVSTSILNFEGKLSNKGPGEQNRTNHFHHCLPYPLVSPVLHAREIFRRGQGSASPGFAHISPRTAS